MNSQYKALKIICALILLFQSSLLVSQVKSSTVTGTVTDSTGAVVPDADVIVTNEDTNIAVATKTSSSGDYTVPYLIAGTYKVEAKKAGFNTVTATGAQVLNNSSARVELVLKIGTANSTVEVNTGATSLQTESVVQGSVDALTIDSIPNINENPLLYATLQPGVAAEKSAHDTTSTDSFGIGPHSRRAQSLISINGGLGFTTDIQLDGVPILASDYNEEGILPNQEGLQEVQVQTNTFSAEYGRGTGIVQYSTKTGTNQFHGSAVYRLRNEDFNANGFANNFNDVPRAAYRVNYYGGSVGGPVLKDKLFFFFSYEGLRHIAPVNFLLTVPTALERTGDYSCTMITGLNNAPVFTQFWNPFSATPVPGQTNLYQRTPVSNNTGACGPQGGTANLTGIVDPVGLKAYSNYPMPNRTAEDVYGDHNFFVEKPQVFTRSSYQGRADYKWRNHSFYGAGGLATGNVNVAQPFGADNPFYPPNTWGQTITDDNPYAAIGDTVIFSPTLVLDVRYGVNRMQSVEGYGPKSTPFDNGPYNLPAGIQALVNDPTEPYDFCPEGKYDCLNYTVGQHINEHQTNHSVVGSMSKTENKWTFKAGAEYRVGLLNSSDPNIANFEIGNRWENQNYTSQYTDANGNQAGGALVTDPRQGGYQAAQYLVGAGTLVSSSAVASALAMKYTAVFEQTEWKATPKLTLNFGVRWELQPGPTERYNKQSSFDFKGTNPFGPGSYVFPGANGYGRNLYATHYKDFGPRFGVAYFIDDKTVIRGGIGMAYLPTNTGFGFSSQNNTSFTAHNVQNSSAVFGPNPDGLPLGPFYSQQVNPIVPAIGSNIANPLLYGGSNSYYTDYRNTLDGRVLQWNAFLEKTFTPSTVVSIGYSASRGDQLPFSNFPVNGYGGNDTGSTPVGLQTVPVATLAAWRQQYIASGGETNPAFQNVPNPYFGTGFQGGKLSSSTIEQYLLTVPYSEFPDLNVQESNATSNYQSLIAEVRHTYSYGLEFDASYVFSKELDDTQNVGQSNDAFNNAGEQNTGYLVDINNLAANRHVGYNDIPNRIVVTGLYESPFGLKKRFLSNSRIADALIGGWRVGTSFQFQSGNPIEITSSMGSLNNRPNRVPGVNPLLPKSLRRWYGANPQNITIPGPSGPVTVSSCTNCYEYVNPLAFSGPTITTSAGIAPDIFWYGNARVADDDIRSPSNVFLDAQLLRDFRITERFHFQLAANAFNVLNHTNFQPQQAFNVGGISTSQSPANAFPIGSANGSDSLGLNFYDPRQLQIQGKITF